ncbi:MAG: hypothetical protein HY431_00180 [Candidatus Levybacteria bacterium]|nr:hypothetical protein [Candidatus Levybacteria bacterium]
MKVGHAFADHIKSEKIVRWHYQEQMEHFMRSRILLLFFLLAFGLLLFRLISLQLFQGSYYRTLSDSNRIRTKIIYAPRGVIFDRNGVPLVFNKPGYREIEKEKTSLLNQETALSRLALGAKNIEIDSLREYPYKDRFSHILGFVGQISKEELASREFSDYHLTDWIGKTGIERQYEHVLSGTNGKQLIEVDAMGKFVRTLGQTDPIPGRDITVTIDSKLQDAVFAALHDVKKGAVVVSMPKGEILAMISKPTFDPNLFTLDATYKASTSGYRSVTDILTDSENQPMMNRAIAGVYPPGSTFKIITAASGLENKVIDSNFLIKDTGVIKINEYSFSNWLFTQYGRTDGDVNVVKAISRSNDIFFYTLAEMVNVDRLSQTAGKFGIGRKLSIPLGGEEEGVLPTQEWKKKTIGEPWYLGDTFIYGIGQGYLLTTPLQVNAFTQVIANGGTLYQPKIIKNEHEKVLNKDIVQKGTIDLIREGMVQACSPGGVAWPLFEFRVKNSELRIDGKNFLEAPQATVAAGFKDYRKVTVACKTGTAQHGGEKTLPHAWITLFAPAYNPEIVVTVLAESSGEGSSVAAPIAKKVLEAWFTK